MQRVVRMLFATQANVFQRVYGLDPAKANQIATAGLDNDELEYSP